LTGGALMDASPRFFRPADWLYDHTPLHEPLLIWAKCWGAGEQLEERRGLREMKRQIDLHSP
jgi:hypothetical protein